MDTVAHADLARSAPTRHVRAPGANVSGCNTEHSKSARAACSRAHSTIFASLLRPLVIMWLPSRLKGIDNSASTASRKRETRRPMCGKTCGDKVCHGDVAWCEMNALSVRRAHRQFCSCLVVHRPTMVSQSIMCLMEVGTTEQPDDVSQTDKNN